MFKFLKKAGGDAPPDVGQEEAEVVEAEESGSDEKQGGIPKLNVEKQKIKKEIAGVSVSDGAYSVTGLEVERLKARLDSIVEWINQFYERFSYVSESIGEIRMANLDNEKKILSATKEAEKVIDIVKEVKPDKLRLDYQKVDMRVKLWEEKLDANRLVLEEVLKEFNELKKKAEVFTGVEGVLKLNDEVKKDLFEIQKISSKVRMYADKTEDIFQEIRNDFAESQKTLELVHNLDANYAGLKKEVEKLRIDHQRVVGQRDFSNFQKIYGDKLSIYDSSVAEVEGLKQKIEEIDDVVGTVASVAKKNQEDVLNISLKTGNEDTNVVSEYRGQLSDLVLFVEVLAGQVLEIKKKMGIKLSPLKVVEKRSVVKKLKGKKKSDDDVEEVGGESEPEEVLEAEEEAPEAVEEEAPETLEAEEEVPEAEEEAPKTEEEAEEEAPEAEASIPEPIPKVAKTLEPTGFPEFPNISRMVKMLSQRPKEPVKESPEKGSSKPKEPIKKVIKEDVEKLKKVIKKVIKKEVKKTKKPVEDENYKDQLKQNPDDIINKIFNKGKKG